MLEKFNQQIDRLVEAVRNQPKFGWAVVTSVDPLLIRYDGQVDPVLGTPDRLVSGLEIGDRVWVQRQHRRDIILGAGGNYNLPDPLEVVREDNDSITNTNVAAFTITGSAGVPYTVPKPTWCDITYNFWAAGAALRVGIELRGATTIDYRKPAWGDVARTVSDGQYSVRRLVKLNTGTTNVKVLGYKESAAVATAGYQILRVIPIRFD